MSVQCWGRPLFGWRRRGLVRRLPSWAGSVEANHHTWALMGLLAGLQCGFPLILVTPSEVVMSPSDLDTLCVVETGQDGSIHILNASSNSPSSIFIV
jgi:predicted metal-dependent enzyme (double-stranded beta helix superfamily)